MVNINNSFKKEYDEVLFMVSILKRLNAGNTNQFIDRLISQKVQYFAQIFGVSPEYNFNLYLRGPYSPDLANDLYEINKSDIKIEEHQFASNQLEVKFGALSKFIINKSPRDLEIISTLHWLMKVARLDSRKAMIKLKELKNPSAIELQNAFKSVEALPQ